MELGRLFILAIILMALLGVVLYFTTPPPPEPKLQYRLTIDTHGIDTYYLTIKSKSGTISETVVGYDYGIKLDLGEYNIEVCYWNVNNTKKCESQRIWLDEDVNIDFFVDVIE